MATEWTSFELEYNLGGAHYKAGHIGPCILHYERARQLRPNDDDLNANLLLAQASVTDRIEAMPEIGMASICASSFPEERLAGWTAASLLLWFLGFAGFALRLFSRDVAQRRTLGLTAPGILLLLCALVRPEQADPPTHRGRGRRGDPGPSGGGQRRTLRKELTVPDLFILHEGTVVEILREQDGWTMVRLANGNTGWIRRAALEAI